MVQLRDWGGDWQPRGSKSCQLDNGKNPTLPTNFSEVRGTAPLVCSLLSLASLQVSTNDLMPKFLCGSHQGAVFRLLVHTSHGKARKGRSAVNSLGSSDPHMQSR